MGGLPRHVSATTGNRQFAECLRHSAKPKIHSVKALPSAALGKEQSAKNPSAKVSLPSATYRALGKAFAECHVSTRQKKPTSNLTASLPSATSAVLDKEFFLFKKKILCRVPYSCTRQRNFFFLKKKIFAECHGSGTRQNWEIGSLLPSFAECHDHGTRQSPLCRVWHSAKRGKMLFFFVFLLFISTNKEITYISTHSTGYITYTSIFHHIHIHNPSHTHPPFIIHHIQIHCP